MCQTLWGPTQDIKNSIAIKLREKNTINYDSNFLLFHRFQLGGDIFLRANGFIVTDKLSASCVHHLQDFGDQQRDFRP